MGYTQAQSFADAVDDGDVSLEVALRWHLEANHYPPVGFLFGVAWDAIQAAKGRRSRQRKIKLPAGVRFRDGSDHVSVADLIESLHLEPYI